jgi:hypothetical protein
VLLPYEHIFKLNSSQPGKRSAGNGKCLYAVGVTFYKKTKAEIKKDCPGGAIFLNKIAWHFLVKANTSACL